MQPPSSSHHTIVHVHESFFLFAQFLYPSAPPHTSFYLFPIYESVFVLFVSSLCSLDSKYEWDHMVFVFPWLVYFTSHNALQVYPHCLKWLFIAALFIITKIWKQPKWPSVDEWRKQLWDIYTVEYYSAIKKKKILPFETIWMDLENIILSEISQSEKDKYHMISLICGI